MLRTLQSILNSVAGSISVKFFKNWYRSFAWGAEELGLYLVHKRFGETEINSHGAFYTENEVCHGRFGYTNWNGSKDISKAISFQCLDLRSSATSTSPWKSSLKVSNTRSNMKIRPVRSNYVEKVLHWDVCGRFPFIFLEDSLLL